MAPKRSAMKHVTKQSPKTSPKRSPGSLKKKKTFLEENQEKSADRKRKSQATPAWNWTCIFVGIIQATSQSSSRFSVSVCVCVLKGTTPTDLYISLHCSWLELRAFARCDEWVCLCVRRFHSCLFTECFNRSSTVQNLLRYVHAVFDGGIARLFVSYVFYIVDDMWVQLHMIHCPPPSLLGVFFLGTLPPFSLTLFHPIPLHFSSLHFTLRYSTSLHFASLHSLLHFTSLLLISLHFKSLHFTPLHFISLHFTSFHFISLHLTSLHFTSLHFPLHFTSLHFYSLHFTPLHFSSLHFISFHLREVKWSGME